MAKVRLSSYMEQTQSYNDAIAVAMTIKHLKQADVAKRLKKSQSTVSRKLKDIDQMTFGELRELASYLGLEIVIRGK